MDGTTNERPWCFLREPAIMPRIILCHGADLWGLAIEKTWAGFYWFLLVPRTTLLVFADPFLLALYTTRSSM